MNKDWLYNEYVIKDRRTADIANEYGCVQNTIQCWLRKHGIKKEIKTHFRASFKQYETYEYLFQNRIIERKSIAQIARENNVSIDAIRYHLIKNGIDYKKVSRTKYSVDDINKMTELYCNHHLSANAIAKQFNTNHGTIIRQLKNNGIATRGISEAQFNYHHKDTPELLLDGDKLFILHWNEGKSCKEIGQMCGCDAGTVRRHMNSLGVQTKSNAESKIGLMKGQDHPNWRGGVTPLNFLLREFFHTNQVPKVAKRDGYTCQLCGKSHTVLHVHHIRHFSDIVAEICGENPELSLTKQEDYLQLYDIITHDDRFLDNDNLITLCKDCHFYKVHNYNSKTISSQASDEEGSETIPTGSTP